MSFYPDKIQERLNSPANVGVVSDGASGVSASLVCGSFVQLTVGVDPDSGSISDARFRTNGCGFMAASADVVCEWLRGKTLPNLHGLNDEELAGVVRAALGRFGSERVHCAPTVFEALRSAMAAYRAQRIGEFTGEKALICTCFGVSEESIVNAISERNLTDVEQVSDVCRAGSGCGSCRLLIQELIDMPSSAP